MTDADPPDEKVVDAVNVTPMPTIELEQFLEEHQQTSRATDAHPIEDDVLETVGERGSFEFSLAAIQAVADQVIEDIESATLVETDGNTAYYNVTSDTFYRLAARTRDIYPKTNIQIERLQSIVDAHTIQFLADLHGYEGDFGGETATGGRFKKTLCNALNDETPYEGSVRRETEPDEAHYGFVDARGLVVQRGTHSDKEAATED